jgi:hypothetical protein
MLNFLKRLVGIRSEPAPPPRKQKSRKRSADHRLSGPAPLPDVVEGNDQTDWDLWQDSVDSQHSSLSLRDSRYQETAPSELGEVDPFAKVGRNRDI